jgi:FimV-like protein
MSRGPYPILLLLAMSLPGSVRALGLGDIRVDSALNEPLSAQIDIVGATRDELAALTASVANRDIFQRYGADRPSFLATATFKVGTDAQGRPVLNVRSADAFTDPLVSFLVDLRWGKNEIVREYSLLLDPPNYRFPRPAAAVALASVAPATPVATATTAATAPLSAAADGAHSLPAPATQQALSARLLPAASGHSQVTIAAGDTLRGVARRAGARTETQAQTLMIAIYRANPNAFDGNINRMHRGAVLILPTATEVAAVSNAEAKREVRAQMTAWRLDGRPAAAPRVASASGNPATSASPASPAATVAASAAAAATAVAPPDASLKNRVQSLEQQLDQLHQQLASENATIQALKQTPEPAVAQSAPAAQSAPVAHAAPPAVAPPAAVAAAPAVVQAAAQTTPAKADVAELVSTPIIAAARPHKTAPVAGNSPPPTTNSAEIFGPVAVTLGLLLAGFAYLRRRLQRTPQPAAADSPMQDSMSTATTPPVSAAVTSAGEPMSPLEAFKPAPRAGVIEAPRRPEPDIAETVEHPMMVASAETTSSLEVDIEALERSYLESLPGESAAPPAESTPHRAAVSLDMPDVDPALADTTTVETVSVTATDLDTALLEADFNTVMLDVKPPEAAPRHTPVHDTALDFNLVDLDATAQHVHMPSGLNDHPVMSERRTNIIDVLKLAVERDPQRRDLQMKLLETYYGMASSNQRAFMDVVRKLSRERGLLTADDWKKVTMMGREIAADDILFADLDPPKDDGDLAHCA